MSSSKGCKFKVGDFVARLPGNMVSRGVLFLIVAKVSDIVLRGSEEDYKYSIRVTDLDSKLWRGEWDEEEVRALTESQAHIFSSLASSRRDVKKTLSDSCTVAERGKVKKYNRRIAYVSDVLRIALGDELIDERSFNDEFV